ncbi:hypothetical protein [Saccharicrinis sp. FJH54]|uniref:hypothetical protein n=1 Tax=Saccharicrinis sp. FJH54 TaxID=3344665 RepID=UPI0035D52024
MVDWIEQIEYLFDKYKYPYVLDLNNQYFEIHWEYIMDFHFQIAISTNLLHTYPIDKVFWEIHKIEIEKLYQKERRFDKVSKIMKRAHHVSKIQ